MKETLRTINLGNKKQAGALNKAVLPIVLPVLLIAVPMIFLANVAGAQVTASSAPSTPTASKATPEGAPSAGGVNRGAVQLAPNPATPKAGSAASNSASTSSGSGSDEAANTVTTSLPKATAAGKASKWQLDGLFRFQTKSNQDVNNKSADAYQDLNELGPRYKITDTFSVFVRPNWTTTFGEEVINADNSVRPAAAKTKMGDTAIGLTKKKFLSFAGDGSVTEEFRYYLPTAESNRTTGQQGYAYQKLVATKDLPNNFSLAIINVSLLMNQSQGSYTKPDGKAAANAKGEMLQLFSLSYQIAKHLEISETLGGDFSWSHAQGANTTQGYIDTSISTDIIPHLTAILGVTDEPYLNDDADHSLNQNLYRAADTNYYFWLAMSI